MDASAVFEPDVRALPLVAVGFGGAPVEVREQLSDGSAVTVRPVSLQDAQAERSFFAGLSASARRQRFHLAIGRLPDALLRHLTAVDHRRHVALVAEAEDDTSAPTLVADARYVMQDDGDSAEFAIVVTDGWQRRGLGRLLLTRMMQAARGVGLRALFGDVLADNRATLALARSLGGRVVSVAGDATLMRVRIPL